MSSRTDLLSESEARAITDRVLSKSTAEHMSVRLASARMGNTRSAVNRITTAGEITNHTVAVSVRFGMRQAAVTTNRLDDEGLAEAAEAAAVRARLAPENPELMPLLGPQQYDASVGYFDSTADLGSGERGEVAADAIRVASRQGDFTAAGYLRADARAYAIANSAGLFAYRKSTMVDYELTVRSSDGTGSGWAGSAHRDWSSIDARGMHDLAAWRASMSRKPGSLEPGDYPVVFSAECIDQLVGLLAFRLNARTADEGRSAFSAGDGTRIGEKLLDEKFTLVSDPIGLGSAPYDRLGMPLREETWFQNGTLSQLAYDRFWGEKQGARPTVGLPAESTSSSIQPQSLRMAGGAASLEDLVRGLDKGLLVTRLHYIRSIDPRTILYTGLTRDGVFWVESGEIVRPIHNFRWNDSPLTAFASIEELGLPERTRADREVPPARLGSFHFSTVSEAV
jgi:predicted Zn-dependent protease